MVYKTFHKGKYFITFKRGYEESKKDLTLAVEKLFENDSLVGSVLCTYLLFDLFVKFK